MCYLYTHLCERGQGWLLSLRVGRFEWIHIQVGNWGELPSVPMHLSVWTLLSWTIWHLCTLSLFESMKATGGMSTGGNNKREQLTDSSEHSSFYSPLIHGTAIGCELRVTSDCFWIFKWELFPEGGISDTLAVWSFRKFDFYMWKKQHNANWNRAQTVNQLLSVNSSRLSEVRFVCFFYTTMGAKTCISWNQSLYMNCNKCATLFVLWNNSMLPPRPPIPPPPHFALFFTNHQGMCSVPFLLSGYCHRLQYQGPLPGPQRSSKVHCSNPLFHCCSVNTQPLSACSSLCGLPSVDKKKKEKREGICVMFLKHNFFGLPRSAFSIRKYLSLSGWFFFPVPW